MAKELSALVAAGREAWPKLTIEPEAFIAHLERHAGSATSREAFLEKVHAGDLYLACGVALQDPTALAYFEEHFMARVPEYVLRVRVGRDVIDEVQQKLREVLIMNRKIAEYSGKGALGGWLRVTAVRTALNQLRSSGDTAELSNEEPSVAADPELAYVKDRAQHLLSDAFQRVLSGLDPKERTILRLHYIEGLTMDQLARLYQTPRSTIARRVTEVRQQILAATESLLVSERRLSPSAVASVIRAARSQLHVTISRLLS